MAAANPVQSLQQEATCCICLEYYKDPVTTKCGHSFCRPCVTAYSEGGGTALSCPQCRAMCPQGDLRANRHLQNIVELVKQLSVQRERPPWEDLRAEEGETPPGEGLCAKQRERPPGVLCAKHDERLKLFCKEDEKLICVICRESKEHASHTVRPIKEAAKEYELQLQEWLQTLRREKEAALKGKQEGNEECIAMRNKLEAEKRKIETEFQNLQQLLIDQEQTLLRRLEEMDKKIAIVEKTNIAKLSAQISCLEALITEIEEKCDQPAEELLKDTGSILNRCEHVMDQAPARSVKSYKVRVTLDKDTAHNELALSEEGRRVRGGATWQGRPDNPKRFTKHQSVLGREGFISGRHYWELQLLQDEGWAVGVVRESVNRKEYIKLCSETGVWSVRRYNGRYWAFTSPEILLSPHQHPLKLGLYMDYEDRWLSVYNADTMEVLYTFTGAAVKGRVYPFFYVNVSTDLRLL